MFQEAGAVVCKGRERYVKPLAAKHEKLPFAVQSSERVDCFPFVSDESLAISKTKPKPTPKPTQNCKYQYSPVGVIAVDRFFANKTQNFDQKVKKLNPPTSPNQS